MANSRNPALTMDQTRIMKKRFDRRVVTGPWVDWKLPCASGKKNNSRMHTTAERPMHRPNSDVSMSKVSSRVADWVNRVRFLQMSFSSAFRFHAFLLVLPLLLPAQGVRRDSQPSPKFTQRVQKQIAHEILMLPYYGVFDVIGYKIEGYNVALFGHVVNPTLKSDAEHAVRKIEGVEKIDNHIEILPLSPLDDGLRRRLFRAIYGYPALQRYGVGSNRPIHIIVDHGNVTLEGAVDSIGDKNLVTIRANGIPDVFSVTNNLQTPSKRH
jgi:hyperosmotically inducible periplasmic protein